MKIKYDLVTNSSSTSFFFLFKGETKEDLFEIMKDNWRDFEINPKAEDSYDKTNVNEIIDYIDSDVNIQTLEEKFTECVKIIQSAQESMKMAPRNPILYHEIILEQKNIVQKLNEAKKLGYSNCAEIYFHDNEGEKVGFLVGYSNITIDKPNLIVFKTGEKR